MRLVPIPLDALLEKLDSSFELPADEGTLLRSGVCRLSFVPHVVEEVQSCEVDDEARNDEILGCENKETKKRKGDHTELIGYVPPIAACM